MTKAKENAEERNAAAAAKCRAEHTFPPKLSGWDLFRSIGSPRYIVAPMVDQSELAWRVLSRRYNSQLCYTPMFNAKIFAKEEKYRDEHWAGLKDGLGGGGSNDRPLITQFCANDPEWLLQAALLVAPYCDAVDINLGCPQHIARRGHYGSFLMEDWPLVASMISTLHKHLPIPVTAKIRVFPEAERTVEYAKMVVEAGAQVLVVHGRLRDMKGHLTGIADWEKIRMVQEARCLKETGCAGVMSAEGNLYNPAIFMPGHRESWRLAEEYLAICDELDTKIAYTRGHLFKLFRPSLNIHTDLRSELGLANSREVMWVIIRKLKERLVQDEEKSRLSGERFEGQFDEKGFPILPHWDQKKAQNTKDDGSEGVVPSSEATMAGLQSSTKRSANTSGHRDDEDHGSSVKVKKPPKNKKAKRGENRFDCPSHLIKSARKEQEMLQKTRREEDNENETEEETNSRLPRVDSQEAIAGVALEGMIIDSSVLRNESGKPDRYGIC
ncbi:hypothetical protein BGZ65_001508 [Modicella reniformis]|uniref:tRNA-dihydrouridine(16/17) synthase [NAD(P)(+)] n=1 Tax=Modicella reniformis TaxID=1440133 RepID=A0A9P6MA17_9FUNG|nr:hypothetical protein BGZ65_001508 [Modicella reniformis]